MKRFRLLWLACASLLLLACNPREMIDKLTPKTESAYAQKLFADLREGHYDTVKAALAPSLRALPDIDQKLVEVRKLFPAGQPKSVKVVGAYTVEVHSTKKAGSTKYNLTYEYEYADSWLLTHMLLERNQDGLQVLGFHAQPLEHSLESTSAFTLEGKGPLHWLFLALIVAVPLFCIYAFVACLRTPNLKRKWLWALFTLIGMVTVTLNWGSGAVDFHLINFQLFGASAINNGYSPWLLSISFPLGAVWFLCKRHAMRKDAATPPEPVES